MFSFLSISHRICSRVLALLIMACLCIGISRPVVILSAYTAQRATIARMLCEQRTVRNNCCQGKCYVRKQLKEEDRKERQQQQRESRIETTPAVHDGKATSIAPTVAAAYDVCIPSYSFGIATGPDQSIFHPPRPLC